MLGLKAWVTPEYFLPWTPSLNSVSPCGFQEVARLCTLCQGVLTSVRQAIEELEGAAESKEEVRSDVE